MSDQNLVKFVDIRSIIPEAKLKNLTPEKIEELNHVANKIADLDRQLEEKLKTEKPSVKKYALMAAYNVFKKSANVLFKLAVKFS